MARPIRVAAAGDIHCSPETRDRLAAVFERVEPDVDMFLLAGDLTTLGEPEQAQALADICQDLQPRVVAVLGTHDWHANRVDEIVAALEGAGVTMLNPGTTTCDIDGTRRRRRHEGLRRRVPRLAATGLRRADPATGLPRHDRRSGGDRQRPG